MITLLYTKKKNLARAAGEERAVSYETTSSCHSVSLENLFIPKAGELKSVNVIIVPTYVWFLKPFRFLQRLMWKKRKVYHRPLSSWCHQRTDVTLAEASNAFIVGFNARPTPVSPPTVEADAEIRLHSIIWLSKIKMRRSHERHVDPEFEEKVIGEAIIRETLPKCLKLEQSVDLWLLAAAARRP